MKRIKKPSKSAKVARSKSPSPAAPALLKLNLGAGQSKVEGFISVDNAPGAEQQVDLFSFPWPWPDNSVEETFSSHFLEHVPGKLRGKFMDELFRVLIPGGKAQFIVPYWASSRAIQDYTHEWPPIAEQSFLYFNAGWREANGLTHYLCSCDFDWGYNYIGDPETASRSADVQPFWIKHYLHAVSDLQVTMTSRKGQPPALPGGPAPAVNPR